MKIVIHGLNYAPEIIGIAVYTTQLAEALSRRGHEVTVVVAKPYYPAWRVDAGFVGKLWRRTFENGVDVTRVAVYVPSRPTGLRRILHHLSFAAISLPVMIARTWRFRPNIVITVAPSLIAAPVAHMAARLVGAESWLHIQDFEVEAAMATSLIKKHGFGPRLALGFEGRVLRAFDSVSSISPVMCRKCLEKGVPQQKLVEFRNWADIHSIKPLDGPSPYREYWSITTPHVVLYSGSIANKQGLEIITDVARRLLHRTDLTFIICGNGPNRANLEANARDLTNVRFYDLQPPERLSDLLGLASLHLLVQRAEAKDLVLPSKLANMLASGRPVIATAAIGSSLAAEVMGCGVVVPPENPAALADAIESLLGDDALKRDYAREGRTRAETRWSRDAIISAFEETALRRQRGGRSGAARGHQAQKSQL